MNKLLLNRRLLRQVDELVNLMRSNVIVWKRKGTRIRRFHGKLDRLTKISRAFKLRAKRFHNAIWWKHNRMKTILQLEIGIVFAIVSVILATHKTEAGSLSKKPQENDLNGAARHQDKTTVTQPNHIDIDDQTHSRDRTQDTLGEKYAFVEESREISSEKYI
ncbi:synaptobrevin 1 [Elysia marginata]|uniref:Synaptobrevin 1 n=1 Tax=Elysia marginata TaxID=1093978 RepID=A0AAV4EQ69_9GAST|nr:synaptobrevin 1 [Elysia marginata]